MGKSLSIITIAIQIYSMNGYESYDPSMKPKDDYQLPFGVRYLLSNQQQIVSRQLLMESGTQAQRGQLSLFVNNAEGPNPIELPVDATVSDLRDAAIEQGIMSEEQTLLYAGEQLSDTSVLLADLGVGSEAVINVQDPKMTEIKYIYNTDIGTEMECKKNADGSVHNVIDSSVSDFMKKLRNHIIQNCFKGVSSGLNSHWIFVLAGNGPLRVGIRGQHAKKDNKGVRLRIECNTVEGDDNAYEFQIVGDMIKSETDYQDGEEEELFQSLINGAPMEIEQATEY